MRPWTVRPSRTGSTSTSGQPTARASRRPSGSSRSGRRSSPTTGARTAAAGSRWPIPKATSSASCPGSQPALEPRPEAACSTLCGRYWPGGETLARTARSNRVHRPAGEAGMLRRADGAGRCTADLFLCSQRRRSRGARAGSLTAVVVSALCTVWMRYRLVSREIRVTTGCWCR